MTDAPKRRYIKYSEEKVKNRVLAWIAFLTEKGMTKEKEDLEAALSAIDCGVRHEVFDTVQYILHLTEKLSDGPGG
jgi:hypothetical protein